MYDKNNVFAKIIRGELPSAIVAESKYSLAFRDRHPQARVHVLVVPRGGFENVADFIARAGEAEQKDFWKLVLKVAECEKVRNNFRLVANTGEKAGQSVPHFHAHILGD